MREQFPKQVSFENEPLITISGPPFREGTTTHERDQLFKFENGAMGDYINWMASIKWVAEKYTFLRGHLICPGWFVPIAANVLKGFDKWKVYHEIPDKFKEGYPIKQAPIHPVNATMVHLLDLGFLYYAGINPPPLEGAFYPTLDLEETRTPAKLRDKKYIVMTPGATAASRTMPAETFNRIKAYILCLGYTPVFVGVTSMNKKKRKVSIDPGYDFSHGIDLIDQTTPLQAAKVMANAEMVVGLDNGLLHLAAMTDVPIVFGYTIAGPVHRRPLRKQGVLVELYSTEEELPCTFCQERVRFFYDHDFENCIYKDFQCIKNLDAKAFNHAIDVALKQIKECESV